jgi:glycosyltransferase involved in cell wall biosynthesis
MNVAVDCEILSKYADTGIATYLINLLRQFSKSGVDNRFDVFVQRPPRDLSELASQAANVSLQPIFGGSLFWKLIGNTLRARALRSDVLLIPAHRVPVWSAVPTAVVMYDLGFEMFPECFRPSVRLRSSWAARSAARKADRLIAISECTKRDLIRLFGCRPEQIDVVYLGYDTARFEATPVSPEMRDRVLAKYGIKSRFLLHVGILQPRKNLVRLIYAFVKLMDSEQDPELQLVLVGRPGWDYAPTLRRAAAPDTLGRVLVTGPVEEAELPILYKSSLGLVFPSLYEGFGLPVIEAMACGALVACSRGSSLTEVVGDAALLFDPYSVDEMVAAMRTVCSDSAIKQTLVNAAFQQIRKFSWENTARDTMRVFESLVSPS